MLSVTFGHIYMVVAKLRFGDAVRTSEFEVLDWIEY